ncbi:type II toxin-antitoxin system HicB family antitoxin [Merismopedia glauca]|uniref:HicB family protein n=1 Tax=Merismopedia glauca CCAP 1448/3 TaxID=1296344 RepID=A0A2T1BWT4_9CYAN|nr:type II toxin-antitoxin system HicB family antitoxin [Merismopedia glauca]PSB00475.1 HicB family protein [Merismopedia glauca CCAP 1448/3]
MTNRLKYQMAIQWSEEDNCFLVGFPDFPGQQWRTHGETYEEAVNQGIEALESLVMAYEASGERLPEPSQIGAAA